MYATVTADFDIHGIVGIRLVNAGPADVTSVARQVQTEPGPLDRQPDIELRFEDDMNVDGLNLLGLNWAAFKDSAFYVLNASDGRVEAQIPLDEIGAHCRVVCARNLSAIPLLADLINLTFLSKGFVALHGSAFSVDDAGVLVVGWEKGGKTEALLAFVNRGAHFVGDEMMVLSDDGGRMFGLPMPISVWEWQKKYLPGLVPKVGIGQKAVFGTIAFLDALERRFGRGRARAWSPVAMLRKALPTLKRQLRGWYWPHELFAGRMCESVVGPDTVFLVASHSKPTILVEPCDPMDVADRMRSSNEFERTHLYQYYRAFKFAFPHRRNEFLETLDERQARMLRSALAGKTALKVTHPYPVSLDELYDAMCSFVSAKAA